MADLKGTDVVARDIREGYLHGLSRHGFDGIEDLDGRYEEFHDRIMYAYTYQDIWDVMTDVEKYAEDVRKRLGPNP